MDLNLYVLCGRLATKPELREFESGTRLLRILLTVRRSDPTPRVDVIPVTWWRDDDNAALFDDLADLEPGRRIWVTGEIQRRFWQGQDGRRSQIECLANAINTRPIGD